LFPDGEIVDGLVGRLIPLGHMAGMHGIMTGGFQGVTDCHWQVRINEKLHATTR
jgi:hypothetical protein